MNHTIRLEIRMTGKPDTDGATIRTLECPTHNTDPDTIMQRIAQALPEFTTTFLGADYA